MQDAIALERIRVKFLALDAVFDERSRRQWAAAEARDYGHGGVTAVAAATGLARDTIAAGLREIVAEHGIGKMKVWRIAAERYRNPIGRHPLFMKNVAGLHNLMFA